MLTQVQKENEPDRGHTFQDTYFESFLIHHLTTIYHFEHINHDNLLNFLPQSYIEPDVQYSEKLHEFHNGLPLKNGKTSSQLAC